MPSELDAERVWRVLVDALELLPDSQLIERDDWVQVRTPSSIHPGHNRIFRARLAPDVVEERIAAVLADHAERGAGLTWIVDPSSHPHDLSERLSAAGIPLLARMLGMTREVPSAPPLALPEGCRIERATSTADAAVLGDLAARGWSRAGFARAVREWAERNLADTDSNVLYWLAYLGDALVGFSTLRVLPDVGYLQGACIVPEARRRGIYRALTWVRLAELHRRGVGQVVIWAFEPTSAPIVRRLGFREVTSGHCHELAAPGA